MVQQARFALGAAAAAAVALLPPASGRAASFTFADFSSTAGLTLNGSAAQSGSVLRLVPSLDSQAGSAFWSNAIALTAGTSFSTSFSFEVTNDPASGLGVTDGFAFVLQNAASTALGAGGQGLGYVGLSPSIAVVFRGRDPSFIGAVFNGTDPANLAGDPSNPGAANFAPPGSASGLTESAFYGAVQYAWIDYDAAALSVFLSATSTKPLAPIATASVDLSAVLGASTFIGFTAGNGGAFGTQDILSWTFSEPPAVAVPAPAGLALFSLALVGLAAARPRYPARG